MNQKGLPRDVKTLQAMVLELAVVNEQLSSTNEQLSSTNEQLTQTITDQTSKIEKLEQHLKNLFESLRGRKRERIDPNQMLLFDIGELESLVEETKQPPKSAPPRRRKRPSGSRLIPDHLPVEEVLHELPQEKRLCPKDNKPMPRIRWEESKQLEFVPPSMKVILHKRAVYACPEKHDESKLLTAPKPAQPIAKGLAGPGLLAQVVLGKFGDHLPGYRLEDIFSRYQVPVRRSTIYDWLSCASDLVEPLCELMKQQVLASRIIHTDDTTVKLMDSSVGGTRQARFWAYLGDKGHPYTVYDFTETRKRAGPESFLEGFAGYLQADAYGGYDGIYLGSNGRVQEVSCWAHCRRYWYKAREQDPARSAHSLGVIQRLYNLEHTHRESIATDRHAARVEHALPLLSQWKQWLCEEQFLPKSLIGKAATYTLNQWAGLCRYTENGELSIDNNRSERAMKTVAIGRKAWLFVGSVEAGKRAARLMSLVASCKENEVEPWAYLRDIFKRLPSGEDPAGLLPDRWLQENPKHRWTIASQRKKERQQKSNL